MMICLSAWLPNWSNWNSGNWTDWLLWAALLVVLLIGVFITLAGFPGLWLMIAAALLYGWLTGWQFVGLWTLITITALAIIAEVIEFLAGAAGAKKAGGSTRAAWGALIGGIIGAIVLSIPVPIIGTTIGLCIGVFAGAVLGEMSIKGDTRQSMLVAVEATKARLIAVLWKVVFAVAMMLVAAVAALPLESRRDRAATMPVTRPTSGPSTMQVEQEK